jgi:hypothetical protein
MSAGGFGVGQGGSGGGVDECGRKLLSSDSLSCFQTSLLQV